MQFLYVGCCQNRLRAVILTTEAEDERCQEGAREARAPQPPAAATWAALHNIAGLIHWISIRVNYIKDEQL
jgi:hypothetical protein